jgi:hypothetical protein
VKEVEVENSRSPRVTIGKSGFAVKRIKREQRRTGKVLDIYPPCQIPAT